MRARTRTKVRNRVFRTGCNRFVKMKSYALQLSNTPTRNNEDIFLFHAPLSEGWSHEFTITNQPRSDKNTDVSSRALTRKELTQLRDLFTRALGETEPKNDG